MRYVLVDLQGASREYFASRDAARNAILELEDEEQGIAAELYVVAYGDDGGRVGEPERGDELLSRPVLNWSDDPAADPTSIVRLMATSTVVSGASSTTQPPPTPALTREFAGAGK
jgi:hypothetical protein